MTRWQAVVLAATLLLGAGCSELSGSVARYRAERMLWQARRDAQRLSLGTTSPDSTTLLKIRDEFSKLRATFKPPFVEGRSDAARRLSTEISRLVGGAELTAASLALQAHRPDSALEQARWVASIAQADTGLHREADFVTVAALRALRRHDEAIDMLYGMLERYAPTPPPSYDREDRILSIPDAIVALRDQMGDSTAARRDRLRALEYYRRTLKTSPPPVLEAQLRAKITHTLIELGDATNGYAEVSALRKLVSATPALRPVEPEILYSEARIRSMGKDPKGAMDLYDLVVMLFPRSRFASRALYDSGVILEKERDFLAALARYRAAFERPGADPDAAAIATYRAAMVKEQTGNWAEAKQLLDGIPVQYPASRAALEAPFAIVTHYVRTGEFEAKEGALLRAVDVYRGLIARDTTSALCSAYRWNILRAYGGLRRWNEALATIDEMAIKDRGQLITAEALLEGANIAKMRGDAARSNSYLHRLALEYPRTPYGARAQEVIRKRTAPPGTVVGK